LSVVRVFNILIKYSDYQHKCSVSNATLNRFFSLHYLLPFLLAALAVAHLIAQIVGPLY
jgi:ubiquinol-cytochrome c reductase cytochrome b subunit